MNNLTNSINPINITDSNDFDKYIKYKRKYLQLKYVQNGGLYSKMWVFNKLVNIIEQISPDWFDRTIHIYIEDKKLELIAKNNDQRIKQIIKTQPNYKKKFYHVSSRIIGYPMTDQVTNNNSWLGKGIYQNPNGIWLSCGISWQKYIGDKPSQWSLATFIYEIEPNFQNVLVISDLTQLETFISQFKKLKPKIHDIINWKKVKKLYSGLIICPYLGNKIWGPNANKFGIYGENVDKYINKITKSNWSNDIFFTAEWYRHWEEASGVIWKPSTGIISIRLIDKINLQLD